MWIVMVNPINNIMIGRREFKARVSAGLERSAIVALLGPRRCGKTTLARTFLPMGSLKEGVRLGVEIKRTDAPTLTRSMKTAMADLELDELWVIYPGERSYARERGVMVKPLGSL